MKPIKSALKLVEREISVKAPWGKIAALSWGSPANPPVLLCHGKLDACSSFRPLVSLLPTSFFYVSIDLPGNGRSDHFAKGARYTVVDFVPTVERMQEHFKWKEFAFIGHSLGAIIGKYYNIAYPNTITRMVELDPLPAHETWALGTFSQWYHNFYKEYYSDDKYGKFNGGPDTAPKYTYDKAVELMMTNRGLTTEAAQHVLERSLVPAGGGLFTFTYDQRQKKIPRMPWTAEHLQELYTSTKTPTFCILATGQIDFYDPVPFIKDETAWPNKNYRVKIVEGGHDIHVNNPECMADDIAKFLLSNKAKL